MAKTLHTVVLFFQDGRRPWKYRNVHVPTFTHYARRVGARYANLYDPTSKQYAGRVYYQDKKQGAP